MFNSQPYIKVKTTELEEIARNLQDALSTLKLAEVKIDSLKAENKYLKELVDKLTTPTINDPNTFKVSSPPYIPSYNTWTMKVGCSICGVSGMNGLVCVNPNCPSKVTCTT